MATEPTNAPVTLPKEPSMIGRILKISLGLAFLGALAGVAVAGIAAAVGSSAGVFEAMSKIFTVGSSGIGGVLMTGAAMGAIAGGAVGVPVGAVACAKETKAYYRETALPIVAQQGMAAGAQMQREADVHEMEINEHKWRSQVAQRDPKAAIQLVNDKAKEALSQKQVG